MSGRFKKDHHRVGCKPALPILPTKHAIKRYRQRYLEPTVTLAEAQESFRAFAASAVWAGKTSEGRLLLRAGDALLVVQRWECKLRILTVLPVDAEIVILDAHANIGPRNPGAQASQHPGAAYVVDDSPETIARNRAAFGMK
jgi:hypothetical protein